MRRLPIYFLIDVSESMVGEPIFQVQNGIRTIIQELRTDPYALDTVHVSVIAFAGKAKVLSPMTELFNFYPPIFPIGGGTSLGTALNYLMDDIDKNVVKTTLEAKGDWKPIIFLFTDGTPTDNPSAAFARWNEKYRRGNNLVAISIGDNVDTALLGDITDNVLRLNQTDAHSFNEFFKWVTASIKTTSVSVTDANDDEVKLAPVKGINLEKVNTKLNNKVDENFAVIMGKCQISKRLYLMKYAKRLQHSGMELFDQLDKNNFKLSGAYTIDEEEYNSLSDNSRCSRNINTMDLLGVPTCPYCGNQFGFVVCSECGNIFCAGEDLVANCPHCEAEGFLGGAIEGGMDVHRTRG